MLRFMFDEHTIAYRHRPAVGILHSPSAPPTGWRQVGGTRHRPTGRFQQRQWFTTCQRRGLCLVGLLSGPGWQIWALTLYRLQNLFHFEARNNFSWNTLITLTKVAYSIQLK
jgi:hypothetical protein